MFLGFTKQYVPLLNILQTMKIQHFLSCLLFIFGAGIYAQAQPAGKLTLQEEPGIIKLKNDYRQEASKQKMQGYRVQIYNGDRKACEMQRAKFVSQFPQTKVQTVYESPEYKVQAGNFKTKLAAERFLYSMNGAFSGFVVRTIIIP